MSFYTRIRQAMVVPKPTPRPATMPGAGPRAFFFPGSLVPIPVSGPAFGNPSGDNNYPSVYRLGSGTFFSNFFDSIFGGTQSGPVESEDAGDNGGGDPGPPDEDPGYGGSSAGASVGDVAGSAAAGAAAGAAGGPFGAILGGVLGLANVGAQMYLMKKMGSGEAEEPSPRAMRQALRQQLTATYTALAVQRAQAASDVLTPTAGGSDTMLYVLAAAAGLGAVLIWRRK